MAHIVKEGHITSPRQAGNYEAYTASWVQGFRISGLGFRVLGFRISGLGFRVLGFWV